MRSGTTGMNRGAGGLLGVLSLALLAQSARAQADGQPATQPAATAATAADASGSEDAEARALFEAGRVAFEDGRFEPALDYFERAYGLSNRPALLYNVASAADRLRRDERALQAFELYLQRVPDSVHRATVEARIEVLRRALAHKQAAADAPATATPQTPSSEPAAAPEPAADAGPGIAPWLVVAASGVVAVSGAVMLVVALDDVSTVEDAPDGTRWSEIEDAHDRAPLLSGIGIAMIGVGAAGAVAGLLWAGSSQDAPAVALTPGGFVVRGRL